MNRPRSTLAALLCLILCLGALTRDVQAIGGRSSKATTSTQGTGKVLSFPQSFWYIGCLHIGAPTSLVKNYYQYRAIIDSLNVAARAGKVQALVIGGDWAEDALYLNPDRADSLMAILGAATFPVYMVLGNHEAIPSDTLNGVNPYTTAMARFPNLFAGTEFYKRDTDYFRFIILNNNANFNVSDPNVDYRVNNPWFLPEPDGLHGMDHAGIMMPTSPQRKFLSASLKNTGGRLCIVFDHRPIYGSNVNVATRQNFAAAGRGNGYVRYIEQQLPRGRRLPIFHADQHIYMTTEAVADSHLCTPGESGLYHIQGASGFGLRTIDTTSVFPAGTRLYKSYLGMHNPDHVDPTLRLSNAVANTWTHANYANVANVVLVSEVQYWGDRVFLKTFVANSPNDVGSPTFNGLRHLYQVDQQNFNLDVRAGYAAAAAPATDAVPPSDIADLSAGTFTEHTGTLGWTAPGDDGTIGTATSYDLRYSTALITSGNFSSATQATGEPSPLISGSHQTYTLTGLSPGTTYWVAMKTTDELGNTSNMSNVTQVFTTSDVVAPAAVANLAIGSVTTTGLTVSWTSPGDDGSTGTATTYDLRQSTAPITAGNFSAATAVSGLPSPAVAGTAQSKAITGLSESTSYYFALKTSDEVPNVSAISNVVSATTLDGTAPAAIANLSATVTGNTSATLGWTAPGDDGAAGTATTYDLRYSTSLITSGNFGSATQATGEPAPTAAGSTQSYSLTGLAAGTTYWAAMKTADEVPNTSTISNVVSFTTSVTDTTAPAAVTNLSFSGATPSTLTLNWTAPGDDGSSGTATSYSIRYATSPVAARGRVENVANGSTWAPSNSPYTTGNFAQAVGSGASSYAPLSAATKLLGQPHPMLHSIAGGTNPVTAGYAECLSAILGGTFQHHAVNETWTQTSSLLDGSIPVGSFGTPTGPGTIAGNLASRSFTHANVYVNLSTSVTQARPGGTLAATGFYVDTTPGGFPGADCDACFPHQGGIYWDNLTVSNIDAIKGWTDIALSGSNLDGPTDGNTHIPASPLARVNALRAAAGRPIRIATQLNGFSIFISDTDPPNLPSAYYPQQVRLFNKANALHAFIYNTDGVTPLDHDLIPGNGNSSRLRYFDITNTALRTWLAADTDSLLHADGLDYLFMDQIESSLASEITVSGCTSGCWPTSAAWEAAWQDFFVRLNSGIATATTAPGSPAPQVAGTSQSLQLAGLGSRVRYFASMRTSDEGSNVSAISNVPTDTTTALSSAFPVQRSFVTYDGGSDMSGGLRTALAAYAPKYIDSPRPNDAAWFNTNAPSTYALMYNSLSDDYCAVHNASDTTEYHWKKTNAVANGCADSEEPYLHVWNDTIFDVGGTSMLIKGWGGPKGTATSKAEARVYVYYSDKTRVFCNFSTAAARQTHRKWLTTQQLSSDYDGFWMDNAFSRYINTSTPGPYMSYPATGAGGGTFLSGFYYHCITAVTPLGETCKSQFYPISVGTNGTITLSWSAYSGATGYKIYRSTTGDFTTGNLLLATVGAGTTTYTDTGIATTAGNIQQGRILEDGTNHCYLGTREFFNWNWFQSEGKFLKEFRQGVAAGTYAAELGGKTCKIAINVANVPQADDSDWNYDLVTFGNPGSGADHPADVIFTEFEYNPCRYFGTDYPNTLYQKNKAAADAGVDLWWTGFASGIGAPTGTPSDTTAGVSSGTGTFTASEWLQNGLAMYWVCRTPNTYLQGWAGTDNSTWTPTSSQYQLWNFKAGWDVDLGQPAAGSTGVPYLLASGTDPKGKAYKVWAREFQAGWAIVRMRGSYNEDIDAGTAVTVTLPQALKPVLINGTVAATPVSSITVRNGQGWVFKK